MGSRIISFRDDDHGFYPELDHPRFAPDSSARKKQRQRRPPEFSAAAAGTEQLRCAASKRAHRIRHGQVGLYLEYA
jgi:hypothetical protein